MMKKHYFVRNNQLSILLSFVLMMALLAGCGGNAETSGAADSPNSSSNSSGSLGDSTSSKGDDQESAEGSAAEVSAEIASLEESGVSPVGVGIAKYFEAKGKASDTMNIVTEKIGSSGDPLAVMALMPLTFADLTIMPLMVLTMIPSAGDNLWEGEFTMMFSGSGRIQQKGATSDFTLDVSDLANPDNNMQVTGKYDSDKESLRAEFKLNNNASHIFEFSASGGGYASQLYSVADGEVTLIKNAFNGDALYSGIVPTSGEPDSIYQKKVEIGEGFVKNDGVMLAADNGAGYVVLEGRKVEF
jgi:hypothetical protein